MQQEVVLAVLWLGSIHWLLCNGSFVMLHMVCGSMALHSTNIWRVLLQFSKLPHLELATPCSCPEPPPRFLRSPCGGSSRRSNGRRLAGHLKPPRPGAKRRSRGSFFTSVRSVPGPGPSSSPLAPPCLTCPDSRAGFPRVFSSFRHRPSGLFPPVGASLLAFTNTCLLCSGVVGLRRAEIPCLCAPG